MRELSQGIPISIHLTTKVEQAGETQDFLFDLQGQAVKIGDTLYLRYKEIQPEGAEVPVTMKIMPDGVIQLIRSGEMRTRLKFAYKERLETSYQTPLRHDAFPYIYKSLTCESERSSLFR